MASLRKIFGSSKFHKNAVVSVADLQILVNQILEEAETTIPTNVVTTDTAQTITGLKTFTQPPILDFTATISIGDASNAGNSTVLIVNDGASEIDVSALDLYLGDVFTTVNGTYIRVHDATTKIVLSARNIDISSIPSAADDASAAVAGVAVGEAYVNSGTGTVQRRLV